MTTRMLVCFKTAAELNNFTKAANQLYLTQPALSKIISNLESELNCALFEKNGRNIVLTLAGKAFYKHVVRALEELNEGTAEAQYFAKMENSSLALSVLLCTYAYQLPEKLLAFRSQYPDCNISVEYKYTSNILKDLLTGSCNLGICGDFPSEGKYLPLEKHLLFQEPVVLAVGYRHRFANRESVNGEELEKEPFVVWNRSRLGTNKLLYDLGEKYGFTPNIINEHFNDFGTLNAVASGEGIAIIPYSTDTSNAYIKTVKLNTDTPITRDVFVAWKRGALTSNATKFRDILIESARLS